LKVAGIRVDEAFEYTARDHPEAAYFYNDAISRRPARE
jgi:hypothetical protein